MKLPVKRQADAPLIAEGLYSYQIGGSERVGVELAIEFVRRGYRVVCFAFYDSDGPMRSLAESSGIRCLDFNYLKRRWGVRRFTYQFALWRMLKRERVDALHIHHATALILSGVPAWLARTSRVVMTEHALHQFIEQRSYRLSTTRYCRFADAVTLVEARQVQYFHDDLSVPMAKLHHVPNGTRIRPPDRGARDNARRQIGVPDDAFVLLFAGRLQPIKDLDTLLRALTLLPPETHRTLCVWIAGDGPERARLEHLRDEFGLSTVMFLGPRSDVGTLMHAADAFIMTSISEGLPMALLEAMATGVPCIATAVGGIPELFADGGGILVPVSDAQAVANAIALVLEEATLRERMSRQARTRIVEAHDFDRIVTRHLELLGLPPRWPDVAERKIDSTH